MNTQHEPKCKQIDEKNADVPRIASSPQHVGMISLHPTKENFSRIGRFKQQKDSAEIQKP